MLSFAKRRSVAEQALAAAFIASSLLLAGAHVFEAFGYAPCPLCLDQREAHWAALGVAAAGLVCGIAFRAPLGAAAAVGAAALVYAASAVLAGYHTGVEFGFWPGPASCAAGGGSGITDVSGLAAALTERPTGPSCSDAAWRFLGISMAGYNFLASTGLAALTGAAFLRAIKGARAARTGVAAR